MQPPKYHLDLLVAAVGEIGKRPHCVDQNARVVMLNQFAQSGQQFQNRF